MYILQETKIFMSALKLPKIILGISVKGNVYTLSAGETEWVPLVDSQRNIQVKHIAKL